MGYTTEFRGSLGFNKPVTEELKRYINKFANIRHMSRDVEKIKETFPNWKELCYKGELGDNGEYFIGGTGFMGQDEDSSIVNYNCPPATCPELWCQWIIDDNDELSWDGNEKFYCYVEWLEYLIKHFFEPEGYLLNGTIEFQGESWDDRGKINVKDNDVNVVYGDDEAMAPLEDYDTEELIAELEGRGYRIEKVS